MGIGPADPDSAYEEPPWLGAVVAGTVPVVDFTIYGGDLPGANHAAIAGHWQSATIVAKIAADGTIYLPGFSGVTPDGVSAVVIQVALTDLDAVVRGVWLTSTPIPATPGENLPQPTAADYEELTNEGGDLTLVDDDDVAALHSDAGGLFFLTATVQAILE